MVPSGQQIHHYASPDQCSSEPQRQPVWLYYASMLRNVKLLEQEPEASWYTGAINALGVMNRLLHSAS